MQWSWCCLHCRGPLAAEAAGTLRCTACARQYPIVAGIPILVTEPSGYLRSELALLARTSHDARERMDSLDRVARDVGLTEQAVERHRDALRSEAERAETLLSLLEPVAPELRGDSEAPIGVRPSGWTTDSLLPYLLRDWTSTSELEAVNARIGAALDHLFPDPADKSVVFAACGAGGLLAEVSSRFERVLGFDLTFPVLRAARHLLDGNSLELSLPRAINSAGRITLRKRDDRSTGSRVELVAMDAFDTAFADGSVECVITSFLIDLIPDPLRLAEEIFRILCPDGIWINYGPSGPLNALWRFDQAEITAFLEAAGFVVLSSEAFRATHMDLSRDCPSWSFQNHVCYLTCARKAERAREHRNQLAVPADVAEIVPVHFAGATLVHRRELGARATQTTIFRCERIPGRRTTVQVGSDDVRIMTLVDGKKTVNEIANLLERESPALAPAAVQNAFVRYFQQSWLSWRAR